MKGKLWTESGYSAVTERGHSRKRQLLCRQKFRLNVGRIYTDYTSAEKSMLLFVSSLVHSIVPSRFTVLVEPECRRCVLWTQYIFFDLSTILVRDPSGLSSHQANAGNSGTCLPLNMPSSQSVTLTTLVLLQSPPCSVCSIVCFAIRPCSSNSNMNIPQNSSASLSWPSPSLEPEMKFIILSMGSFDRIPIPR
jgi:hypothetical protein